MRMDSEDLNLTEHINCAKFQLCSFFKAKKKKKTSEHEIIESEIDRSKGDKNSVG